MKIDESRTGNFDFRDLLAFTQFVATQCLNKTGRNFARILAGRLRQSHRNIAGEIAMARVTRTLNGAGDVEFCSCFAEFGQRFERVIDEICDYLLHCVF
jgi:hypothetical protein